MELVVFPIPTICEYLTKETKQKVFITTEKDEQNSKINGFFNSVDAMWNEMKWQRKLRQRPWLYWFSSHISLSSEISFNLANVINFLLAIFYPFDSKVIKGRATPKKKRLLKKFFLKILFYKKILKKSISNGTYSFGSFCRSPFLS
jgi:inositol 1,4,5-triphosphate receptor type 2